jgi:hypothetical protein
MEPEFEEWRGTGLCPQAQADGVPCISTFSCQVPMHTTW